MYPVDIYLYIPNFWRKHCILKVVDVSKEIRIETGWKIMPLFSEIIKCLFPVGAVPPVNKFNPYDSETGCGWLFATAPPLLKGSTYGNIGSKFCCGSTSPTILTMQTFIFLSKSMKRRFRCIQFDQLGNADRVHVLVRKKRKNVKKLQHICKNSFRK